MNALYIAFVFVTCTICSVAGVGGGVLIKPLFDAISPFSSAEISAISLFSVLSMAIFSVVRHARGKAKIQKKWALETGIGSVPGGVAGQLTFHAMRGAHPDQLVKIAQNLILLVMLTLVLFYTLGLAKKRQPRIQGGSTFGNILITFFVSALCSFVGIGGGPINICLVSVLYSITVKEAAVYSLMMIVCSQATRLVTCVIDGTLAALPGNLWPLIGGTALAGMLAGILGARLNRLWSERAVHRLYLGMLIAIMGLTLYNLISLTF